MLKTNKSSQGPVLILLGPPGAGKGTQARYLVMHANLYHLSTGDLLRHAVSKKTPAGIIAKKAMENGDLVSDELVLEILSFRLSEIGESGGVILDGFPRTLTQATMLDNLLATRSQAVSFVISLNVDDDQIITRISGRFSCANCNTGYHDIFQPTEVNGVCDKCGSNNFVRRADDNIDAISTRLAAYNLETAPLISHYNARGLLKSIDASKNIENVSKEIQSAISEITEAITQ